MYSFSEFMWQYLLLPIAACAFLIGLIFLWVGVPILGCFGIAILAVKAEQILIFLFIIPAGFVWSGILDAIKEKFNGE